MKLKILNTVLNNMKKLILLLPLIMIACVSNSSKFKQQDAHVFVEDTIILKDVLSNKDIKICFGDSITLIPSIEFGMIKNSVQTDDDMVFNYVENNTVRISLKEPFESGDEVKQASVIISNDSNDDRFVLQFLSTTACSLPRQNIILYMK
jgi:hypothetical protein